MMMDPNDMECSLKGLVEEVQVSILRQAELYSEK